MQATAKIIAILKDPAGTWEDETRVEYPAGQEVGICLKLLTQLRIAGGLVRVLDEKGDVQFIPMERVKDISIKLNTITLADNFDAAQAAKGLIHG